ncbi:exodeoxyribonuclease III [Fulvivirga maritima]|uniref:exodeoxyribonuclease III n=1 Tax=Fulvivirga maritima TaxID=2904247 RepID=UPI001F237EE6|nr:exodeoxyribonuclease III [Fulvivirga maritima]UII29359.1 exodeoxyribonuclease III [Fulvivirga maritima]
MSKISIVSWNVNGIRAIVKKEFVENVKKMDPDILCLQETKGSVEDVKTALELLPEYKHFANASKARKGYSGTAILTKEEPISVTYDLDYEEHDQEGRVITAEFESFYLINVYTPNSGQGLKRLDYRQTWDEYFLGYMKKLEEKKPVILCGDLNVAHEEIDIARPKQNYNKSAGFTQQEIDGFDKYLAEGYVDAFRHFYPEEVKYSYWNYMFNARANNVGWRIDYFLVSQALMPKVEDSQIHNEYMGSDHCPVELVMKMG